MLNSFSLFDLCRNSLHNVITFYYIPQQIIFSLLKVFVEKGKQILFDCKH